MRNFQTAVSTHIVNWTHVYMNLFTRKSPYYHLLKYVLFFLKHPVYGLSPYRSVSTLYLGYKNQLLMLSLFVLRSIPNTQKQCEQHLKFLNVNL